MSLNQETDNRDELECLYARGSDKNQRLNLWPSPLHPRRSQLNLNRIYRNTVFVQLAGDGPNSEGASKTRKEQAAKARTSTMRARSPASRLPGLACGRSVPPNGPAAFQRMPLQTPPR
jgi:hypothetical protein